MSEIEIENDDQPLLTIGIPTYNGEKSIYNTFKSIKNAISNKNEGLIEVVVSDNASTDLTLKIVNNFKNETSLTIRYFCNDTNLGFDRNVDVIVKHALGKYVWLLSDDDTIAVNAIDIVIEQLSKGDYALAVINFDNSIKIISKNIEIFQSGNSLFEEIKFKNGLISSNIVNRSIWLNLNMSRYFDTEWIHMGYAIEAAIIGKSLFFKKYFVTVSGSSRWGKEGSFIYTGLKLAGLMQNLKRLGYSRKVQRLGDKVIKDGYYKFIPLAKAEGLKLNSLLLKTLIKYYGTYFSFWCIDFPLLIIPGKFYNLLLKYYRFLKHYQNNKKIVRLKIK